MLLTIEQIKNCLPHRPPMLLVDSVLECDPPHSIKACYTPKSDNHIFEGHFPNEKVWPGVLTIEGSAQAAGVLISMHLLGGIPQSGALGDKLMYLASVDTARFSRLIKPDEEITYQITVDRFKGRVWKISSEVSVADEKAGLCSLTIMLNR